MNCSIGEVSPGDFDRLAPFLAGFPGLGGEAEFWRSRFHLWWEGNPAFRPDRPRGWALRRGGDVVGFLASVPGLFQLGGNPKTVFSVSTWMVLPGHRDESLRLLVEQMASCEDALLFDATPTKAVSEILLNMGFRLLPWGRERESLLIVDSPSFLRAATRGWLGGPLSSGALDALQGFRLRGLAGPLEASPSAEIGPEFDDLWERTRGLHANTNVRGSEILRWHCLADRRVDKRLLACRGGGRALGYLILKARLRRGLRTLECVDAWLDPQAEGAFDALLLAAREYARLRRFALVSFPHFSRGFGARLRRAGLLEAGLKDRRSFVKAPAEADALIRGDNSYFVALQGDYGTSP
jgi:hypothetical protein